MEDSSCAMTRLAWIASEVGSATGFPKENNDTAEAPIRPGSGMMVMMVGNDGWTLRTLFATLHVLLLPDGIVFTEPINSRIVGQNEAATRKLL
jgi:hypothetical protein